MILDVHPSVMFNDFLYRCSSVGIDRKPIATYVKGLRGVSYKKLEGRWYDSLKEGAPDCGVYDDDLYLAELWICWKICSRLYLRAIRANGSVTSGGNIVEHLGNPKVIADLGCGFGYTTVALRQMFPNARVIGTNLENLRQTRMARVLGEEFGFLVETDIERVGQVDLVFASEYFEHFQAPVAHLGEVIQSMTPRAFLLANTFQGRSIGHFEHYEVDGRWVDGKGATRYFNQALRGAGYTKVRTKTWNGRPAYWRAA